MKRSISAMLLALAAFSESDAMLRLKSTSSESFKSIVATSFSFPAKQPCACIYKTIDGLIGVRAPGAPSLMMNHSVFWGPREARYCGISLNHSITITADMDPDQIENTLANGLNCEIIVQNGYAPLVK